MSKKLDSVLDIACFIGIMIGTIIMICECSDYDTQIRMIFIGLAVFVLSSIRPIIKSSHGEYAD